jgi:hypothetical protein
MKSYQAAPNQLIMVSNHVRPDDSNDTGSIPRMQKP